MSDPRRTVWRASTGTLVLVVVFAAICVFGLPAMAYLSWHIRQRLVVPVLLLVLALAGLGYAWRFGLHPRIVAGRDALTVRNPFRTEQIGWEEVNLVLPGGNGLVIAGPERRVEAWCVQKSTRALQQDRRTRADRVADEVWQHWEQHHPPPVIGAVQLRRARPGQEAELAALEKAASMESLSRTFSAERYPFPLGTVTDRWRDVLRDPALQTFIAVALDPALGPEVDPDSVRRSSGPAGFVAHGLHGVLHLGVHPDHQRRGVGSALLQTAEAEMFADPFLTEASLWVLVDNERARRFYRDHGWHDTDNRRRSPFPPRPAELRMIKANPQLARRRRTPTS